MIYLLLISVDYWLLIIDWLVTIDFLSIDLLSIDYCLLIISDYWVLIIDLLIIDV